MQIELTKDEYRRLLIMASIGNIVINGYRTDDIIEEFEKMMNHLCKYAKDFGETEFVDSKPDEKGIYWETIRLDDVGHEYLDEYDDEAFWEELADRLASREMEKQHGKGGLAKMSKEESLKKFWEIEEMFNEEFYNNGIDNLQLNNVNPFAR
ncbi:MAG: hypothetical protein A3I09_04505 [Deltaproteobacteria bacterium RIFCSPLOWO2_02_FULL_47_10]|nr:MAG: hypothetical protein A3I09_04505 [Deltaproteobacteria bacterium RIFCSPLOWO2_02_FULL_47_10]